MKITPIEIRKYEFKRVLRGYDVDEVRYFLEMVADELEAINREKLEMESKVERFNSELGEYRQIEKSMQDALVIAKEASDKSLANARKEADLIVADAEAKADRIVEDARREASRIQSEITRLKMERDSFLVKIKNLLRSEMELLASVDEPDEDMAEEFEEDIVDFDFNRPRNIPGEKEDLFQENDTETIPDISGFEEDESESRQSEE